MHGRLWAAWFVINLGFLLAAFGMREWWLLLVQFYTNMLLLPVWSFINLLRIGGLLALASIVDGFLFPRVFYVAALIDMQTACKPRSCTTK